MRAALTLDKSDGRAAPVYPCGAKYRPHLVPAGSRSMLGVAFVDGPESIAPGGSAEVEFACVYDSVPYDELRPGVRFTVVEGDRRVGTGVVLAWVDESV